MNPKQALVVLSQIVPLAPVNLATHQQAQQALQVLDLVVSATIQVADAKAAEAKKDAEAKAEVKKEADKVKIEPGLNGLEALIKKQEEVKEEVKAQS